ncbi:MAG: leucine-rich repeat domain-containing protein [Treponema sp.]|jgi:hypothetical protein|nr:leucine-rich repeat domain-containing protein [Treponema sp.]
MKAGKRFVLAALFPAVFLFAQTAGQPEGADFEVLQNRSGGVTILNYQGAAAAVNIPEHIGGRQVTVIGARAFYRRGLTMVNIPAAVTAIAYEAFAENELAAIALPPALASIEYGAFSGNKLGEVVLPESLSSVGVRSFAGNGITALTIPERVTYIGVDAFAGNSLQRITMGARRNVFPTQGFDLSFVNYYGSTGKKAGVYTRRDRVWTLEE